jgi:hypothetical protein
MERGMATVRKLDKVVADKTVHSFFLPWRRTHKTWPMTGTRTMKWEEVTCGQCKDRGPASEGTAPAAPTPKKP